MTTTHNVTVPPDAVKSVGPLRSVFHIRSIEQIGKHTIGRYWFGLRKTRPIYTVIWQAEFITDVGVIEPPEAEQGDYTYHLSCGKTEIQAFTISAEWPEQLDPHDTLAVDPISLQDFGELCLHTAYPNLSLAPGYTVAHTRAEKIRNDFFDRWQTLCRHQPKACRARQAA